MSVFMTASIYVCVCVCVCLYDCLYVCLYVYVCVLLYMDILFLLLVPNPIRPIQTL